MKAARQVPVRITGFTLTELAVVMTIVAFLLGSLMYTLSAQVENRNTDDTRRRLELARELILSFAVVNGRLPCPARSTSGGVEVRDGAGNCTDGATEDYYGGSLGGGVIGGLLPAVTLGYQQVDPSGFALDAWNNRIRYVVAKTVASCTGTPTNPHWVNAANMKANGIACQAGDLLVCKSSQGITATTCGGAANQLMTQGMAAAIVFSTGRNFANVTALGNDEAANANAAAANDPIFVYHPPTPSSFAQGEFDDQFTWITIGELYGRLIAAGKLP